jgi:hypothetical protein
VSRSVPSVLLRAVAVAVGLLLAAACGDGGSSESATGDIEGVEIIRIGPYEHPDGDIEYDRHPPVGGDHNPQSLRCGFYDEAVRDEWAVHAIEHGAVWVSFRASLDGDQVDVIRDLVDEHEKIVAAPYPDLDAPVVATAWGVQLRLDSARDPRLEAFIERYIDASSAPEAGGGC